MNRPKDRYPVGDLRSEAALQAAVVQELEWRGFIVAQTDRKRKKCRECGAYSHAGDGVSEGLPDLMVTHRDWPALVWIGIELKRDEKSKVRPAQQGLHDLKRTSIVCRHEDAVEAVMTSHYWLRSIRLGNSRLGIPGVKTT